VNLVTSLYIGNLSFESTNDDLIELFRPHGRVISAHIILEKETKRHRGFGFVEMEDAGEASCAIAALNGEQFQGRPLIVNLARERVEKPHYARFH
jgi:cold-inducible RNA-binding protein